MKIIRCLLFLLLISIILPDSAPSFSYTIKQPDGYQFKVKMYGSEHYSYIHTIDGYAVESRFVNGDLWWCYAEKNKGKLFPSNVKVNEHILPLETSYLLKPDYNDRKIIYSNNFSPCKPKQNNRSRIIRPKLLLLDYNDFDLPVPVKKFNKESFARLMFGKSEDDHVDDDLFPYYQFSVKDYFDEVSNSNIVIDGDISSVSEWILMPESYSYYVNGEQGLGQNELEKSGKSALVHALSNSNIDLSNCDGDFDGVCDVIILVMEGWTSGTSNHFWSFKGSLVPGEAHQIDPTSPTNENNELIYNGKIIRHFIVTTEQIYQTDNDYELYNQGDLRPIGTICHELGHILGLPDLYDTSENAAPGIGDWGLMGSGNWNNQTSPSRPCAWSLSQLGIIEPFEVESFMNDELLVIEPIHNGGEIYKLNIGEDYLGEFLLLENRRAAGFDAFLKEEGLFIWHVDERLIST